MGPGSCPWKAAFDLFVRRPLICGRLQHHNHPSQAHPTVWAAVRTGLTTTASSASEDATSPTPPAGVRHATVVKLSAVDPWASSRNLAAAARLLSGQPPSDRRQKGAGGRLVNESVVKRDGTLTPAALYLRRPNRQRPLTTLNAHQANLKRAWGYGHFRGWHCKPPTTWSRSLGQQEVQELIQTVFKDKVLPSDHARRAVPLSPIDDCATAG